MILAEENQTKNMESKPIFDAVVKEDHLTGDAELISAKIPVYRTNATIDIKKAMNQLSIGDNKIQLATIQGNSCKLLESIVKEEQQPPLYETEFIEEKFSLEKVQGKENQVSLVDVEHNILQPLRTDTHNDCVAIDHLQSQNYRTQYHNKYNQDMQFESQYQQEHVPYLSQLQTPPIISSLMPELPQSAKHHLNNTWTLWYLESDRTKSWEELQNEITSFNSAEDFWGLYNLIKLASDLKVGCDYSLFKKGIRPMWEDEANIKGGRWVISLSRQYRQTYLDNLWLDVLLCLIGEIFDYSAQICGAVVNIRNKFDKISIWTSDGSDRDAVLEIGNKLKEFLNFDPNRLKLVYQMHKDTMIRQSAGLRNMYTL